MHAFFDARQQPKKIARRLALLAGGALGLWSALGGISAHAAAAEGVSAALSGSKPFTVAIDKVSAKRGQPATAKVLFRPASGWHMNVDYPTELRLKLPENITAPKATLTKQDAKLTEQEGHFDVVLVGSKPGKQTVLGELRFAVCTATTCDPQKTQVSIELNVE
jgi:hypothetical protein